MKKKSNHIPLVNLKREYFFLKKIIFSRLAVFFNTAKFIQGKEVKIFEKNIKRLFNSNYVVSCANGTDALLGALMSLKLKKGDEVITTAMSWISTAETILNAGGKPIFVDIKEDGNIDENLIEKKINRRTKAILVVHLYGNAVNMSKCINIARKYKIKIIEDCAQAHLAEWKNKKCGTIGDFGAFSLFPSKVLGAYGDAGFLICKNKKDYEYVKKFFNHGSDNKINFEFRGINSRLDSIQACILNIKLKYLKSYIIKRRKVAKEYYKSLNGIKNLKLPYIDNDNKNVFYLYTIKTPLRDKLKKHLYRKGISTNINYKIGLPFQKVFNYNLTKQNFDKTIKFQNEILSIPIDPFLKKEEIQKISNEIKNFFKKFS